MYFICVLYPTLLPTYFFSGKKTHAVSFHYYFFLTENNAGAGESHMVFTCKSKQHRAKAQAQAFTRFCARAAKLSVLFLVLSQVKHSSGVSM